MNTSASQIQDLAEKVQALRSGVGVCERLTGGVLLVRGKDGEAFLQGLCTNDLRTLSWGRRQANLFCGPRGSVLYQAEVIRVPGEQFLLITEPERAAALAAHLEAYRMREAVEVGRIAWACLELAGPRTDEAIEALGITWASVPQKGSEQIVAQAAWGETQRVLLLMPQETSAAWLETLIKTCPWVRVVSANAFEELRLVAGVPRIDVDYAKTQPAEAGLEDHLSFQKGCYMGQEPHARLRYRGQLQRKLMRLRIAESAPAQVGASLFVGQQETGSISSLGRLAFAGQRYGMATLRLRLLDEAHGLALVPQGEELVWPVPAKAR